MPAQPNILVFFTDDHAQWALGCYGHSEIRSPTMDHLARRGARLNRAFTPSPVCSPARACFFTGRLPSQHGIHDWLHEPLDFVRQHPGLRGQTNIGQLMQAAGYQTGMVGKWHCGRSWEPHPGFDRWFSYGEFQFPHKGEITFSDQGEIVPYEGYQSTAFTDQALEFLRRRDAEQPFFLFVGYVDTHTPYSETPARLVDAYRDCDFGDIPQERFAACHGFNRLPWTEDAVQHRDNLAHYYAGVSFIDEQMGRILDELDGRGELDDTLVVYTADHGHMNGHHGLNTKGNATIPQNFIDESILVPGLLAWPSVLPAGQVLDQPVDHCDLFATLLEAAGAAPDAETAQRINSPGESYLKLLRQGGEGTWRDAFFGEYGNARVVRTATQKLIRRYPGPNGHHPDEFYDLENDPRERENRIDDSACQGEIAALSKRLEEHFARYEISECSGRDMATQFRCNEGSEPWIWTPTSSYKAPSL